MKNKVVAPTRLKAKTAKIRPAKNAEAQAARLAADITAREAEAAKSRAKWAKGKLKSAKKVLKQARKAAKRAAKRAKAARENLTALTKKSKPKKQKTVAGPATRRTRPAAKKKPVKRKRPATVITALPAQVRETPIATPAAPASADESSVA